MQAPVPHVDPQSDPHDDIVAILRSDSLPRMAHDPSDLHVDLADRIAPAKPIPMLELGPPSSALNDNRVPRKRSGGAMRFVLTVCFGIAATVAYQAYGDTAREKLTALAPELLGSSPVFAESANTTDQQTTAQAAAETTPAQPAQPAPAAETAAAPAAAAAPATTAAAPQAAPPPQAAASSPDLTPLVESMSREIASLRESIEQLKTNQRQMSRDIAKAAEEPKEAKPRKQTTAASPPPPPARPVAERLPPQPRQQTYSPPPQQQTYSPPPQQQVYIPPPPPPPQSYGDPYAPRPPRALP